MPIPEAGRRLAKYAAEVEGKRKVAEDEAALFGLTPDEWLAIPKGERDEMLKDEDNKTGEGVADREGG